MDPVVIFDQQLELAAVLDTDTMRALGPAGLGPNAREELQAFIDRLPAKLLEVSSFELTEAYQQYWVQFHSAQYAQAELAGESAVGPDSGDGGDDAALAVREASAAGGEPPGAAPHDADMEADQSETNPVNPGQSAIVDAAAGATAPQVAREIACPNCEGSGIITYGDPPEQHQCARCQGSGRVVTVVAE